MQQYFFKPSWICGFISVLVVQCFFNLVTGQYFNDQMWTWPSKLWLQGLIRVAKYTVFLEDNIFNQNALSALSNATSSQISVTEGIAGFLMAIGFLQQYMLGFLQIYASFHVL